ncbi:MAG: hypothetical protein M1827_006930 [Pycnora praestabilis]|nr:MAG: hypothetical protein M1827_006930 [Pycnora praestabilis]
MGSSQELKAELQELESSSTSQQNRVSGYNDLLRKILKADFPGAPVLSQQLIAFIDSILGENVGIVSSRPLLGSFVQSLRSIPSAEIKIRVGEHTLEALVGKVSFEEQSSSIREILADAFEEKEEYSDSAKYLQGINLDSSQRTITDDFKVRTWIRIMRLFLEDDDTTNAETYLNRVKTLQHTITDPEIQLMFQLSQARILDARRRFLDASEAYQKFSTSPVLAEEERLRALSSAIVCAVLAPAGPQRSRALAKLYKDERSAQVEEFSILEKMFLDRLLSPAEVNNFASNLSPHQLAITSDGSTVLAKAVIEHNLLGASRIYKNIGVTDLGTLLGLGGDEAEEYAARMVEQGRLAGHIDQIDKVIFFEGAEATGEKTNAGQKDRVVGRELRIWDMNVQGLTEEVERVTTALQNLYPEFVAANLVH